VREFAQRNEDNKKKQKKATNILIYAEIPECHVT